MTDTRQLLHFLAFVSLTLLVCVGVTDVHTYTHRRDGSRVVVVGIPTGEFGHSGAGWFYCHRGEC